MIITKLLDWSMIKYEKEKKYQDNGKENSIKGVKIWTFLERGNKSGFVVTIYPDSAYIMVIT